MVAWGAYTVYDQIGPDTELGIMPVLWVRDEPTKIPAAGTTLTVYFTNGAARVDLVEVSGNTAVIQTSDGAKWSMENVGVNGLLRPPAIPSAAPATFWRVKERTA